MKKKEYKNLGTKSIKELEKMVMDKKTEMIKVKAEVKAGKEVNLKKVKNLKIDIAKLQTIIRQKQLEMEDKSEETKEEKGSKEKEEKKVKEGGDKTK